MRGFILGILVLAIIGIGGGVIVWQTHSEWPVAQLMRSLILGNSYYPPILEVQNLSSALGPISPTDYLEKANQVRLSYARASLHENSKLNAAAQKLLNDYINSGENPSEKVRVDQAIKDAGYTSAQSAVAVIQSAEVDSAISAVLTEPSYRANLLQSSFQETGLAAGLLTTAEGQSKPILIQVFTIPLAQCNPPDGITLRNLRMALLEMSNATESEKVDKSNQLRDLQQKYTSKEADFFRCLEGND